MEDNANLQIKEMMEPALVKTDERGEFIAVLTNHSWEPIKLEAGQEVAQVSVEIEQITPEINQVNILHANAVPVPNRTKREAELLKVLGVDATKLTFEQRDELAQLVIAYQDVFALKEKS